MPGYAVGPRSPQSRLQKAAEPTPSTTSPGKRGPVITLVMLPIDVIYGPFGAPGNLIFMTDKPLKRYLFASDFDQTLTFDDSGYVLSELAGIPTAEFERKAQGMAKLNLLQQGAELSYLLLHDPEFRKKVRKQHLYKVGKTIRLKENIELLYQVL